MVPLSPQTHGNQPMLAGIHPNYQPCAAQAPAQLLVQVNQQPYTAQAPMQMQGGNLPIQQLTNQAAALDIRGQWHGQQ